MELSFIQKANQMGLVIVAINDKLYCITKFDPADGNIRKHILEGKDVTELGIQHYSSSPAQLMGGAHEDRTILTKLDLLPTERVEFHEDFKWVMYAYRR